MHGNWVLCIWSVSLTGRWFFNLSKFPFFFLLIVLFWFGLVFLFWRDIFPSDGSKGSWIWALAYILSFSTSIKASSVKNESSFLASFFPYVPILNFCSTLRTKSCRKWRGLVMPSWDFHPAINPSGPRKIKLYNYCGIDRNQRWCGGRKRKGWHLGFTRPKSCAG